MSTIELVDPELRSALAEQLPPLTAETLTQRRANMLELAGVAPKPKETLNKPGWGAGIG